MATPADILLASPRLLPLGAEAIGLWLLVGHFATLRRLNGRVPLAAARALAPELSTRAFDRAAEQLVTAGAWRRDATEILLEDWSSVWTENQQVSERKAKARERMRRVRANVRSTFAARSREQQESIDSSKSISSESSDGRARVLSTPPAQPVAAAEPVELPTDEAAVSPREQDYQAAYERGIATGKGSPYAMPGVQRGELHQAIQAHMRGEDGKALRGAKLLKQIEFDARQFAEYVRRLPASEFKFWSAYGPKGWLRWLNTAVLEPARPRGPPKAESASGGNVGEGRG